MKIIQIEKEDLRSFLERSEDYEFLQTYAWGEFQTRLGQKIFRLGIKEEKQIIAVATLIKKNLGLGKKYFYCPRGPVIDPKLKMEDAKIKELYEILLREIVSLAKIEDAIFLRFEPRFIRDDGKFALHQTVDAQPSKTLLLDLSKSEADLLGEMHQKTRYNVRLAEKKGVVIREAQADKFADFWKLLETTKERDGFRLHEKDYYQKMLALPQGQESGCSGFEIKLLLAGYQQKNLAAGLFVFCGNTVTYLYGASGDEGRNLMAPYLLQWHAIRLGKARGCKFYDFFGIDEDKWPGVTRFKKGFGGDVKIYPGTFDLIFSQAWYGIYSWLRKIRRWA